ncbi:MAG: alkaline phosphatase D family protein [Bacteroidota bacterium]
MKLIYTTLLASFVSLILSAQVQISSGPMPGHFDYHTGTIWLQLTGEADVYLKYWDENNLKDTLISEPVHTHLAHAYTAHLNCGNLLPGTTYGYEVVVDGIRQMQGLSFKTQQHWQYRTDPPAFKLAVGSCTYINDPTTDRPGDPYGGGYEIFGSIADKEPDLMMWLGDNTYFRETDVTSKAGMHYRYTHTRATPEMQGLLQSCNHYAIWDDHDYGPDNSTRGFYLKHTALECFEDFWANPGYGLTDNAGITSNFTYNDVEFFMLDNRWFRSPANIKGSDPTILGEDQIQWLIDALMFSKARFKMVCIGGQFLSDLPKYENYAVFAEERQRILNLISENAALSRIPSGSLTAQRMRG